MTKPFSELRLRMSPESQRLSLMQTQEMLAAMQSQRLPDASDVTALQQTGAHLDKMLSEGGVDVDELVQEFTQLRKAPRG